MAKILILHSQIGRNNKALHEYVLFNWQLSDSIYSAFCLLIFLLQCYRELLTDDNFCFANMSVMSEYS